MPKHYVTFGQAHRHVVNGAEFNSNTIASIEADSWQDGREKALGYFGPAFCTSYQEGEPSFNLYNLLKYAPGGVVEVPLVAPEEKTLERQPLVLDEE